MRILIAEDESELAKGLKFLLEKNKFSVDIAADGAEALDYFCGSNYDVIILDFGNITGHETDLLRQCSGIYVPAGPDLLSQGRIGQWEKHLQVSDGMDILERLQKLELPECGMGPCSEEDFFMLPQQELGTFVRGLLRE